MERSLALAFNLVPGTSRAASDVLSSSRTPSSVAPSRKSSGALSSLIDQRFDHDSCGVGFVAAVDAVPSYKILQQALTALGRLAHRGATAADGKSSDGVGVLAAVPRALLVRAANLEIDEKQVLGVGMLLIPAEETRGEGLLERCLLSHDFQVLCWRDVPVRTEYLGETALATMPKIRQVLVGDAWNAEPGTTERRLCLPLRPGGTESPSLEEAVELLSKNGRTLAEAIRMVLPPAAAGHQTSSFLRYHTDCAEPWDGPAALAFSDGRIVGAALDRNGLRPCRFAITKAGLVVAGSAAGLAALDPADVTHSGRRGPGQLHVVDLVNHKIYEDEALLELFDAGATYAKLAEDTPPSPGD